jgi:N-acetylmuramoyl-L-alanine amidase
MKLAIIVGHTSDRPGAKAGPPLNKHEYEFMSECAIDIWRIARELGLDCQIFKRDGIGIEGVTKEVNGWTEKIDLACSVELHFNSALDIKAHGVETLYVRPSKWAEMVHREQVYSLTENKGDALVKPRDRGLKMLSVVDRGYSNMNNLKAPSCLVEPFFGSNKTDTELFLRNRLKWCNRLVHAAVDYFLFVSKV